MPKRAPSASRANELIRKRVQKWEDDDPSSILTKRMEKATTPLQWLVETFLPDALINEAVQKTLWAAEALTDRDDVMRTLEVSELGAVFDVRLDQCDAVADQMHNRAMATAAALAAIDLAGPLSIAPAIASLFTLALRTIKKIGLAHGFDTSAPREEQIVLEVFVAGTAIYQRDKLQALKDARRYEQTREVGREQVLETIGKLAHPIATNIARRRTLASLPPLGTLVGGSVNVWLMKDVGWAARNVYAARRLLLLDDSKATAPELKAA